MNELELMCMREESLSVRRNLAADLTEQNRAMGQFESVRAFIQERDRERTVCARLMF